MKNINFIKNIIYRVKGDDNYEYCFPVYTGNFIICDCFPCTKEGEILEGYISPIPIDFDDLVECTGKNRLEDI